MSTVNARMNQRSDTAANWTSENPILGDAEIGYEKDTGKVKIGDGTTVWASLAYFSGSGGGVDTVTGDGVNNTDPANPVLTFPTPGDIGAEVSGAAATAETNAKTYADGLVTGLWDDRGAFDASVNAYPSSGGSGAAGAILKGDIWTVSVAGTLPTGQVVEVGDLVRALIDTPGNTQANWAITQNNIGYVPENVANKVATLSGASTDVQYPSAKLAYDQLALKEDVSSFETTAVSAGTTTLTVTSKKIQQFTGAVSAGGAHACFMPVVSTLFAGKKFFIINNSVDTVNVNSSGGNLIQSLPANTVTIVTCILITGITAASWDAFMLGEGGFTFADVTTNNADTTKHGLLMKLTAPAAGLLNVLGIANGETAQGMKALFDTTNPEPLGTAAPGTQIIAARRDHVHGGGMALIEDKQLSGGAAASFDFTSIPATYRHLKLLVNARSDRASFTSDKVKLTINNDTGSSYIARVQWSASNEEQNTAGAPYHITYVDAATSPASWMSNFELTIYDYADTHMFKTFQSRGMQALTTGASQLYIYDAMGLWLSASAINRITISPVAGSNFVQWSRATLYGLP